MLFLMHPSIVSGSPHIYHGPRRRLRMCFDEHVALAAARPPHAREALHALSCEVLAGGMGTENHIPLHNEEFFHVLKRVKNPRMRIREAKGNLTIDENG